MLPERQNHSVQVTKNKITQDILWTSEMRCPLVLGVLSVTLMLGQKLSILALATDQNVSNQNRGTGKELCAPFEGKLIITHTPDKHITSGIYL